MRHFQRFEAIGNLAGGIAHDFNNLLVPIIGYTELLMEQQGTEDKQSLEDLAKIQKAAFRGKELVEQILVFSRKSEPKKVALEVKPIGEDIMGLLNATLPATVSIAKIYSNNLHRVLADPTQLHQVIMNLCVNANQAMPDGGEMRVVVENAELEEQETFLGQNISGDFVRIRVQDSGHGISKAHIERIFDPFFTTKEVGEGTGLGLSTAFGIVSQHGGFLNVESRAGEGAIFDVYLPALPHDATEADDLRILESAPGGRESILFVDDEEMVRDAGKRVLEVLGYRVTTVLDGTEALRMFQSESGRFDLVVTDQIMPGLTGFDLAIKIRTICTRTPIILCTGFAENIFESQAREQGINALAIKPLRNKEFAWLVRDVLDGPPNS